MPSYCYKCEGCGATDVTICMVSERQDQIDCVYGEYMNRDYVSEHPSHRVTAHDVDVNSEAMAVDPNDIKKELNEDRRINPFSAPDYYDEFGRQHWKGQIGSVRRRREAYERERGMINSKTYN